MQGLQPHSSQEEHSVTVPQMMMKVGSSVQALHMLMKERYPLLSQAVELLSCSHSEKPMPLVRSSVACLTPA